MAVIQKIRTKYGKLAGAVIAIALVGFILMDAASGRFGDLFGRNNAVVKVNGDKIDTKEYSERMKEFETLYGMYNKGRSLDDATRAQINEEAIRLMVFEKLAAKQCDKLGMTTSKEEEKELIYGANPDQLIQQFTIQGQPVFINQETGMFDPQYVKGFEQQLPKVDPTGKIREEWETLKNYVVHTHRTNKFNYMFINGIYTPKFLLKKMAEEQNEMAAINYVKVPMTAVNDNEVKVSDDDIKNYMQQHAAMFTVDEPMRTIDYVAFEINPSKEDTARVLNALNQIKGDFATTKDNENFVNRNADDRYIDMYVNKRTFMSPYSDSILSLPVGTVYGPYFENNNYKLTKVVEKTQMPDSVKCRSILIATKSQGKEILSDSAAKQRIDSIAAAIKGGADFRTMAAKYSADQSSAKTGGEYTFTAAQRPQLPDAFANFIFDGKPGESKVIKVDNDNYSGYHYTEILSQSGVQPTYKLATINKALYAGDNTVNAAYAKATEFAGKNGTSQAFDDAVKKQSLNQRIGDNIKISDFTIQGLGPAREIVRWTYEAKVGDVSPVFTMEGRYVVAKLVATQDKGLLAITPANRPMLEAQVKADKKGDMIVNKYKSMNNLQAVAQTAAQQVMSADSIALNASFIPAVGYAPKVVGYSFYKGLQPNAMSPGIKSQDGVYFISVKNRWTKPSDPHAVDMMITQQRVMMEMQQRNAISQMLQETLIKNADVKYTPGNL